LAPTVAKPAGIRSFLLSPAGSLFFKKEALSSVSNNSFASCRPIALLTLRPSGTYRTATSWFSPRTLPVFCFDLSAPGRDNGAPRARIVQGKCLTYF
jgi:hypothetical protein